MNGHSVMLGTRTAGKLAEWGKLNPAVQSAGAVNLAGKTVIDAINPITDDPLINGVLKFFTSLLSLCCGAYRDFYATIGHTLSSC